MSGTAASLTCCGPHVFIFSFSSPPFALLPRQGPSSHFAIRTPLGLNPPASPEGTPARIAERHKSQFYLPASGTVRLLQPLRH